MQVTRWQIDFRRWEICPKRVQKACTFRDFGTLFWHSYGWIIVNYNPWNEIVSKARGMAIRRVLFASTCERDSRKMVDYYAYLPRHTVSSDFMVLYSCL